MRLIFAGTPEFARVALERLHRLHETEVALVLTQPDRPAGRGLKLQASPVKQFAVAHGLPIVQPRGLRLEGRYPEDAGAARAAIEGAGADVMVVAAYGLILPSWLLEAPRLGCLNIHASLLPRWRGAAPIHRAIEAGDDQTGVTIMQMDAGLDTGDMLLAEAVPIASDDTCGSLHDKLAALGAELIVRALVRAGRGELQPVKQPAAGVSYARKIDKSEAPIDWAQPADVIERRIRAFNPSPGAVSTLAGEAFKVWRAAAATQSLGPGPVQPGTVLSVEPAAVTVACGSGALRLLELQRAGGKRLDLAELLRGFPVAPGRVLGTVE
jgi:methionyl-tRNA formyltransferase